MPLSWIPSYEAIATALAAYEQRQPELIAFLLELKNKELPIVALTDQTKKGPTPLEVMDPFTVFATFNRRTRVEHRITIVEALKKRLEVTAPAPTDFEGIPIVDNRASWFFHFAKERKPDEISNLWRLAREVVADPNKVDPALFDRCCEAIGTGMITTGMFWMRPRAFLPLDRRTRALLDSKKIDASLDGPNRWSKYAKILDTVRSRIGSDFADLSRVAYTGTLDQTGEGGPRRRWVGGSLFGKDSQLNRFLAENIWELGYTRESDEPAAKKAVERFDRLRVGDLFAIKTLGGNYQLRIFRVGRITEIDPKSRRVKLQPLDVPLFRGRAPGKTGTKGTWFESIAEVTDPDAVAAIFEGRGAPATLPPPPERDVVPLNLILYGPPGTGKTYALRNSFREPFAPEAPADATPTIDVAGLTWFQVIALAVDELGHPDVKAVTEHPLVQAKYAERAVPTKLSNIVWAQLQGHTVQESKRVNYTRRTDPLVFDRDDDGRWFLVNGLPEELEMLVTKDDEDRTPENEFFVTFHPSFTYEDFVEGMRPETSVDDESVVRYVVRPGIFKQACERAVQLTGFNHGLDAFCRLPTDERRELLDDAPPVVLFIDEINRGNVARIFGELITLLEADKRLGGANELSVLLPGSRQKFGVPCNLWVIGTMNTADRSVVALDTALRRRFSFREHPPQPDLLANVTVEGVDLRQLLEAINRRLLRLRSRDHLIGHAFFMQMRQDESKRTLDELRRVFREAIIPLLSEYFYDDLGRVGLVLGGAFVKREDAVADVFVKAFDHEQREDLADRPVYRLVDVTEIDADGFRSIYA